MRQLLAFEILLGMTGCSYTSVYSPHSSPAAIGDSVEYIVSTDCGLDWMSFDVDGALWVPRSIDPADREGTPAGFAADQDVGTLTFVSEEVAQYRTSQGRVIELKRLPGDFEAKDC